jgi:hypothetical protein
MVNRLPDHIKSLVKKQWLEGVQRDMIAANNGLSAGAVTNIVNEWRTGVGDAEIDDSRELGVIFRKVGITPAQCAIGFRIAMLMSKLGVKEEEFESFILDVNKGCIDLGLSSENVALHIKDLVEFSKTNGNNNSNNIVVVPLSQISDFIQQKKDEKKKLEEKIQVLNSQIKILNEEKSNSEHRRESALREELLTAAELNWYSDLKIEFSRYGVPIYDIPKLAKLVRGISQKGYDVDKAIQEFSDLESARNDCLFHQALIPILEIKNNGLKSEASILEQSVNAYKQTLSLYDELQYMGLGLRELKQLQNTILEISDANNIPIEDAVKRFFKEVEEHYDGILGLGSKKQGLQEEVKDLDQQQFKLFSDLNAFPKFGAPIAKLLGISNSGPEEFSSLVDKIYMVGGAKNAIEKLSAQPMLIVDGKSLPNTNNNNDSQPEKSTIKKLADCSIASLGNSSSSGNGSSTDQLANDKAAVLSVDDSDRNNNSSSKDVEKEKEEQVLLREQDDDDPSFKYQINEHTVSRKDPDDQKKKVIGKDNDDYYGQ